LEPATRLDKDTNSTLGTLKLTNAEAMAQKVLGREKQNSMAVDRRLKKKKKKHSN
jgi:hypothetical protein